MGRRPRSSYHQGAHRKPGRSRYGSSEPRATPGLGRSRRCTPTRTATPVTWKLADEAYALDGTTSADTYLVIEKVGFVARRSGADAVHPGYGFLAETPTSRVPSSMPASSGSARRPTRSSDWATRSPARHVAEKVGAPLAPGTLNPVKDAAEVLEFVDQVGLPVAIKAAFGGGGRGLKVARTREEVPELFESAVREATAAFGRGECFVEKEQSTSRATSRPSASPTPPGTVVVVSTRDCSLQRRHQKLVEEAPAPFLTPEQTELALPPRRRRSCAKSGYVGACTCEFLIGKDGTVSFLEVTTCASRWNTPLGGGHRDRPRARAVPDRRGRSCSRTRIPRRTGTRSSSASTANTEAALSPTPPVHVLRFPGGPGVRVDSGVTTGDVISGSFDSLLAELIVTGPPRAPTPSSGPAARSTSSRSPGCRPHPARSIARSARDPGIGRRRRRPFLRLHPVDL